MPLPKDQAWFPTKTYGYGWGLPTRWQGGVVIAVYVLAVLAGVGLVRRHPGYYALYLLLLSVLLIGVCYWKGERPRWRWGSDRE